MQNVCTEFLCGILLYGTDTCTVALTRAREGGREGSERMQMGKGKLGTDLVCDPVFVLSISDALDLTYVTICNI